MGSSSLQEALLAFATKMITEYNEKGSNAQCLNELVLDLESENLLVAYDTGEIVVIDKEGEIEHLAFFHDEIECTSPSPDEEFLLVASKQQHLCLMKTEDWAALEEVVELSLLENIGLSFDSETYSVSLSWRNDGRLVAVYIGDREKKWLGIFDGSSLNLNTAVKTESSLVGSIAWQPNGRHLYAAGKSIEEKLQVCLFESNGLGHGSFDLRHSGEVGSMTWSLDSQLLAMILSDERQKMLQIWRRSNWHWYLKYERQWELEADVVSLSWDTEVVLRLHVCVESNNSVQHLALNFVMDTVVSSCGTAAVIDGSVLHLTPFRYVIVPPPLSAVDVVFGHAVQCAAFFSSNEREVVAVILANKEIGIAVCIDGDPLESPERGDEDVVTVHPKTVDNGSTGDRLASASHLIWLDDHTIAVFGEENGSTKTLTAVLVATLVKSDDAYTCSWSAAVQLDFSLLRPVGVDNGTLFLQSSEGAVYVSPVTELRTMHKRLDLSFPFPCPSTRIGRGLGDEVLVVGLSSSGHVYQGATVLMERVTSFVKRVDEYGHDLLLLTTRDNKLIIKRYGDFFKQENVLPNGIHEGHPARPGRRTGATAGMHAAMTPTLSQAQNASFFERVIEQGAHLIHSLSGGVDVIFQMPRGNLEVISLRLFVLQKIVKALMEKDFKAAWKLANMNRVNLNLLVDFKWPLFLTDAHQFVVDIPSSDVICDLMTALQQGSLFTVGSAYCGCLPDDWPHEEAATPVDKVTAVCTALRSAMVGIDEERYCRAIAISHARCDPPDLENALMCIKAARLREVNANHANGSAPDEEQSLAGEALKHLMLYIDTADLYRVALGAYDLSLAYMVVTNAQRDPGEYLIELEQFAAVEPESYRNAVIDRHLHRHSRSLTHLLASGPRHLQEALDLATEHHLFHELLSQMKDEDENRKTVLKEYGHWLKSRGMQEDAGAAFLASGELQLALDAFQSCGEWQMVFILADKLNFSNAEIRELALEMVEELKSMERLTDAAAVCVEYLNDKEDAISLLTDARQWRDAVRLCHRSKRDDLIDSAVAPAAASVAYSFIEEFTTNTENITKYAERLKEVRKKRQALDNTVGETGAPDEVTDAASTVAGLSIYTDRTQIARTAGSSSAALTVGGKKPKKTQKKSKKLRIKQGSPEEEAALLCHLRQLKPENPILAEVSRLCEFLILIGFLDDARSLQSSLDTLIKTHDTSTADLCITDLSGISAATTVTWKWDILRTIP